MYLFLIAIALLGYVMWRGQGRPVLTRGDWRTGAGLLAIGSFVAAALLAVRGAWPEAAAMLAIGCALLLGARSRRDDKPKPRPRAKAGARAPLPSHAAGASACRPAGCARPAAGRSRRDDKPKPRPRAKAGARAPADRMTVAEARAILGVGEGATVEDIRLAYARLIRKAHPDHGGTDGLAAQLNAARDRLLGRRAKA